MIKQRAILLVPFPFSDQNGNKVRPVLVLSNDEYNKFSEDVLVCAITSNLKTGKNSIIISQNDMKDGTLYQKSCIKTDSMLKISKNLVIKNIGVLNKATFYKVIERIKDIF